VLAELQAVGLLSRGLDLVVAGNVPQGAGLSSSASLELAVLHGAMAALELPALAPSRMALLAQQAEVNFVGCRCGIMDQLASASASACAVADQALLIDCRTIALRPVALPVLA
jgi:galactokinase